MRLSTVTVFIGAITAAAACKSPDTNKVEARQSKMSISEDVKRLEHFIRLPAPPDGVRWLKEPQPGGGDLSLTAALRFGPQAIAKVLEGSQPFDVQPIVRISRELAVALLPEPLHKGLGDGATVAVPGTAVQPNLFISPETSSFIHGRAVVMKDEGIVLLSLFTM
ncbi:MAG: hypothetical protein SF187_04340 [Deltaproteobacteria bacterium]|nr:hypothetical protein [Deltaproteobacteria bacterium]